MIESEKIIETVCTERIIHSKRTTTRNGKRSSQFQNIMIDQIMILRSRCQSTMKEESSLEKKCDNKEKDQSMINRKEEEVDEYFIAHMIGRTTRTWKDSERRYLRELT